MKKTILILSSMLLLFLGTAQMCHTGTPPKRQPKEEWKTIAEDVLATVYNACKSQCNHDYLRTASMYRIDKARIPDIRIAAMERTMMKEYGLSYGTVIKITGTGKYDGLWRIEDTMNKRFAGKHKIDLLVPDGVKLGRWTDVKVSVPMNKLAKERCEKLLKIN